MRTDVIAVSGAERDLAATLRQAEKMAAYEELTPRATIQLRLLTEEMMQMMRSITGAMEGDFWIENEEDRYELHLAVNTRLTSGKRAQLLATSTSGKNESARGLTGWLRDLFDRSADEDVAQFSNAMLNQGFAEHAVGTPMDWEWSMTQYQQALNASVQNREEGAQEAWDELEKSVVAHAADEVKVSLKGNLVEMVIYKQLT